MNLQQLMDHSFELYGWRNAIHLPALADRRDFLSAGISDLQNAVRKNYGKSTKSVRLSRVLSRIFCIADHFRALPLVDAMCCKYPATHCAYCKAMPCVCQERRDEATLLELPMEQQLKWGLRDWQDGLWAKYGVRNQERGIDYALNRLCAEIYEITTLSHRVLRGDMREAPLRVISWEYAKELADTIAWTLAASSILDIDLQEVMVDRYGDTCGTCGNRPCDCPAFRFDPLPEDLETAQTTFGG